MKAKCIKCGINDKLTIGKEYEFIEPLSSMHVAVVNDDNKKRISLKENFQVDEEEYINYIIERKKSINEFFFNTNQDNSEEI